MLKTCINLLFALLLVTPTSQGASDSAKTFDWNVLPPTDASSRTMLDTYLNKLSSAQFAERDKTWKSIKSWNEWLVLRDKYRKNFEQSMGVEVHSRTPLNPAITTGYEDDAVKVENLRYESLPGFYVTANIYIPKQKTQSKLPTIVRIVGHAMGGRLSAKNWCYNFARRGYFVLTLDLPGQGERICNNNGEGFHSPTRDHFTMGAPCTLTGSNLAGYMINDIRRGIDYLETRPEVDMSRLVLTGESGGGTVTSYVAALDDRLMGAAPVSAMGSDQGHSIGNYDSEQILFDRINGGFDNESRAALAAPRPYRVIKEVVGDEENETSSAPQIPIDLLGYKHAQKIFDFKNAKSNLEFFLTHEPHGLGEGHTKLFIEWLAKVNPTGIESKALLPSEKLERNPILATKSGHAFYDPELKGCETIFSLNSKRITLEDAFDKRFTSPEQVKTHQTQFTARLRHLLKIDETSKPLPAETRSSSTVEGFPIEKIILHPEPGIHLPAVLLKPKKANGKMPVILCLNSYGKKKLADTRWNEIRTALDAGTGILIPDLRGCGETSPGDDILFNGIQTCLNGLSYMLGRPLIGMRVQDTLYCLKYLRERPDIDSKRIALIGDSFSTLNPNPIKKLHLLEQEEGGPKELSNADSLGPIVALLAFGLDDQVTACAIRGSLGSYDSICREPYFYHPFAAFIPEILRHGDITDICASAAPRPLLLTQTVNARNQLLSEEETQKIFQRTANTYKTLNAIKQFKANDHSEATLSNFILNALKN